MKITVIVAVICFSLYISQTKAALKLGLGTGLELPIIGELDTDVNAGVDVQKGLLGLSKLLVKGLMGKATSALLKGKLAKDNKSEKGKTPRLPLKAWKRYAAKVE